MEEKLLEILANSHGVNKESQSYKEGYVRQEMLQIKELFLKEFDNAFRQGHGGGNWRRLVETFRAELK